MSSTHLYKKGLIELNALKWVKSHAQVVLIKVNGLSRSSSS